MEWMKDGRWSYRNQIPFDQLQKESMRIADVLQRYTFREIWPYSTWRLTCSYHYRRLIVQILLSISAIAELHSYNLLVLLLIISRVVTEGHGGQNQIAQAPFITQTVVRSYLKHLHELSFYLVPNIHPYMSCQESALDSNNLIRCIWPAEKIRN